MFGNIKQKVNKKMVNNKSSNSALIARWAGVLVSFAAVLLVARIYAGIPERVTRNEHDIKINTAKTEENRNRMDLHDKECQKRFEEILVNLKELNLKSEYANQKLDEHMKTEGIKR